MSFIVQDIKTDRPNISGGLPSIYRLVPIGFYAGTVLAILLNLYYFSSLRSHQRSEKIWQNETAEANAQRDGILQKQVHVTEEAQAAERIADWVEGSRPVQPIAATVARSMQANATIAELSMDRNPQMPAHLFMALKINNPSSGSEQLETTLDSLAAIDYQTYSAQQVQASNALDFQATLIWNRGE
ncbi:MAG: hypothetical protein KDM63_00800 [Verrucomicrobiae bacterium]|nr:hypothetical protein [Verrucomicrobiae bacterium]MCB1089910.1 hypothetical protein [Verrucomicrobiae bacterium]